MGAEGRWAGWTLVSDLDGTLLDARREVQADNLRAVEAFVAAGGRFTVATGRTEVSCHPAVDALPIGLPVVLYNGAAVYDLAAGRFLLRRELDGGAAWPLVALLLARFAGLCVEVFAGETYVLGDPACAVERLTGGGPRLDWTRGPQGLPPRWTKAVLHVPRGREGDIEAATRDWLAARPGVRLATVRSADRFFELLPEGSGKGPCVRWLAERFGLDRARLMAVGDYLNDLDMVADAPWSGAPENAHPRVRRAARYALRDHERGAVADLLARVGREAGGGRGDGV